MLRRILWPCLMLLVAGAPAQVDEGRTYFSLSTDRPVRAGESAVVRVQTQGVKQLEFRLYKVKDEFAFFEKLEDPHQFGRSPMHRQVAARTTLEKFAAWKRRLWVRYRDTARHQFTEAQRHEIRARMTGQPVEDQKNGRKKAAPDKKGTVFAGVPLLNEQQLVRKWSEPVVSKNRWEPVNVEVAIAEKGVYVLEATDQKRQAYTVISATDLVLITKANEGRVLVRAVDRMSGAGVAGAELRVFDFVKRARLAEVKTGAEGLFDTQVKDVSDEGVLLMARRGQDFAVATVSGYQLSSEERRNLTGYVYTDRPVYRPGHKVQFKSILRVQRAAEYGLPEASSAEVNVEDSQGKTVLKKSMRLTRFGTLKGELDLPADADLGYYSINVALEGEGPGYGAYGGFHVEEYRKPDYEVKVTPDAKRVMQGGSFKAVIDARYYYGEPVAGAKVSYVVHSYRYWPPWWEPEDGFGDDDEMDGGYGGEQLSEEEGKLDADGKLTVTVPVKRGEHDYRYRVEARVTDSGGRAISGAGSVVAVRGPVQLTVRPEKWVYASGDAVRMLVETKDYDGNAVANVAFRVELGERRTARQSGFTVKLTREGRTGADGSGTVEFPAPEGGGYEVQAAMANAGGEIRETSWLYVSGAWARSGGEEEKIQLVPDKSSYKPGEKAKVLLVAGAAECDAWVSLEGKGLYWTKIVKVKGGTATVEVPIESSHAPNVFLEAVFVKEGRLYRGSRKLKVPPVEKTIQVELTSSKPEFKPGEPALLNVVAKDFKGQPVEAEFSVGVVDEAIYAIKREAQPDIVNVFYGRTWNRVGTDTSLSFYFFGEAGKRRMELAKLESSLGRAQLKKEMPAGPKVRKFFPDTAYWVADLKTDQQGKAQVEMTFPDSLTTWRTTARGVTEQTQVGGAVLKNIVRKDVLVTVAAPRFFTEGDEVTLPVLVRNYTNKEQVAKVSLDAQGVQITAGNNGEVRVAPGGEGRIDYRVKAGTAPKAVLTAKALAQGDSDALEITVPVEPYGMKITRADQKRLDGDAMAHSFGFTFPADAAPKWRQVRVRLTPSVAGAVFGALEYLVTYPYGCTEQTMSSFLPNVIVAQALKDLKLASNVKEADLERKVKAGLERLGDYQHEDGGWGWWRDDESDPFMTAYVTLGLEQAAAAGYRVEHYRVQQAREWLMKRLAKNQKIAPDTRAYMVYALALGEKPGRQVVDGAWAEREQMTSFGWAVLGLALERMKDPRAGEAAAQLLAQAKQNGEDVYWPSNRDPMLDFESDNSLEATAFAVRLLAKLKPESELIDRASAWLVNHRDQGYYWSSTKRTAFVVYGLTEVLKRSGELSPDYTVKVMAGGKEVFSQRVKAEDALQPKPVVVVVPLSETLGGRSAQISVEKKGAGRLYASANWEYRSTGETGGARAFPDSNKLRVERMYFKLTPVNAGGRVTYQLDPVNGPLKPGDVMAVHLRVEGAAGGEGGMGERYLLVEDQLPAGAEAVANDEVYELRGKPVWWRPWYTRREARDSRMTWFPWAVPKGGMDLVYLVRFTNAGSFRVAPARVEPMYSPGVMSWSEAAALEVKP